MNDKDDACSSIRPAFSVVPYNVSPTIGRPIPPTIQPVAQCTRIWCVLPVIGHNSMCVCVPGVAPEQPRSFTRQNVIAGLPSRCATRLTESSSSQSPSTTSRSRAMGSRTVPLRSCGVPETIASYRLWTSLSRNCPDRSACVAGSSATTTSPEVARSRRWTTIGPVAPGNTSRAHPATVAPPSELADDPVAIPAGFSTTTQPTPWWFIRQNSEKVSR